jgi:hypothetical protein
VPQLGLAAFAVAGPVERGIGRTRAEPSAKPNPAQQDRSCSE